MNRRDFLIAVGAAVPAGALGLSRSSVLATDPACPAPSPSPAPTSSSAPGLQAQIDAAGIGGIVQVSGTYTVDSLILRPGVVLRGPATFIQASDTPGHHVLFIEGDNGRVERITFVGFGSGPTGNTYGVAAGNRGPVYGFTADGCQFLKFSGGGVQFGAPGGLISNSVLKNSRFTNNARDIGQPSGIAITNAKNCTVDGFIIEQLGSDRTYVGANAGIDLEPNVDADVVQGIIIQNGTIRNTAYGIFGTCRATAPAQFHDVTFQNIEVYGCMNDGVILGVNLWRGSLAQSCFIHDNGRYGWRGYGGGEHRLLTSRVIDNNRAGSAEGHTEIGSGVTYCTVSDNRIGNVNVVTYGPQVVNRGGSTNIITNNT